MIKIGDTITIVDTYNDQTTKELKVIGHNITHILIDGGGYKYGTQLSRSDLTSVSSSGNGSKQNHIVLAARRALDKLFNYHMIDASIEDIFAKHNLIAC